MFPSRKSGRTHTLEEQPQVRIVPSVIQTLHTAHVMATHQSSIMKLRPISQKLSCKNWTCLGNPRRTVAFCWERQSRWPPAAQQESFLHWMRCSCMYLWKKIQFLSMQIQDYRYRNKISDEVSGIIIICIWSLDSLQKPHGLDTTLALCGWWKAEGHTSNRPRQRQIPLKWFLDWFNTSRA